MASKKEIEDCSNCVYDGTHSNLCDSCDDVVSNFKATDIVNCCENCDQLQAELDRLKKIRTFNIETFRQYIENKWNWSAEDVLGMVRRTIISDKEYKALKGGERYERK